MMLHPSILRLSTAQRQSLPENIRDHLTALYAEVKASPDLISCFDISFQNDSLAKQVKGLKAKNNELIRTN